MNRQSTVGAAGACCALMTACCVWGAMSFGAEGGALPPTKAKPDETPKVSAEDREFVAEVLRKVGLYDTQGADEAVATLVARGERIVPAIREALLKSAEHHQAVLFHALIRLTWGIDPKKKIEDYLQRQPEYRQARFQGPLHPLPIVDAAAQRLMPEVAFYVMRFPQYPVGRAVPPPLKASNIFVLHKRGDVELINAAPLPDKPNAKLAALFRDKTPPVRDPQTAQAVLGVWLRLTQEFSQDGMFRFTIPQEDLKVRKVGEGLAASGKAVVEPTRGNRGWVTAELSFDAAGKLTGIQESRQIRAGIRPICQAHKLLDADPVVRYMARESLILMGPAVRGYLLEVRKSATPPLQRAIDDVWREIQAIEDRFGPGR